MEQFISQLIENKHPDLISFLCIPLIIAILAIAFPLLAESRYKIEARYSSDSIAETFSKSWEYLLFTRTIYIAPASILIWILKIPSLVDSYIINHSATLLLLLSTIILLISLFIYINLLRKYNNINQLADLLIKKFEQINDPKHLYFLALTDLLCFAIETSNEKAGKKLLSFFHERAIFYRKNSKNELLIYPSVYYDFTFKTNEKIHLSEKKAISIFNDGIIFTMLIDEIQNTRISKKTYLQVWKLIRQAMFYKDDGMIFSYWKKAHQYLAYFLKPIHAEDKKSNITNEKIREKRREDIKNYKEFHFVLGALILYSENYTLLNKCINYAQQKPLKHFLTPNTLYEVIKEYMEIPDEDFLNPVYYEKHYPFPGIEGVTANEQILMWIDKYFAILFIRQYKDSVLHEKSVDLPEPPSNIADLSFWKEKLERFRLHVKKYTQEDKHILASLGLSGWKEGENNSKLPPEEISPLQILSEYLRKIEKKYWYTQETQPLSENKITQFKQDSVEKIKNTVEGLPVLIQKKTTAKVTGSSSFIARPRYDILRKGAFAEKQDISYIGTSGITAQAITMEMRYYFSASLSSVTEKKYVIYADDLLKAVDKLKIKDSANYIIINTGISLERWKLLDNSLNPELIKKEEKLSYKEIEIIDIGYSQFDTSNSSLFILKKSDLPLLIKHELNKETIEKYSLELLDEEYKIYGSIINLNEKPELRKEIIKTYNGPEDLSRSVLSCIGVKYELGWEKGVKAIQLQSYDSLQQSVNINKLDDISPLPEEEKQK